MDPVQQQAFPGRELPSSFTDRKQSGAYSAVHTPPFKTPAFEIRFRPVTDNDLACFSPGAAYDLSCQEPDIPAGMIFLVPSMHHNKEDVENEIQI
jgi:hypothetical protein